MESQFQEAFESVEEILQSRGHLIKQDYFPLGDVSIGFSSKILFHTFVIAVRSLNDTATNYQFGIRMTLLDGSVRYENFFYMDELGDIIDGIRFIRQAGLEMSKSAAETTKIVFASRDGHRFGIFQFRKNQNFNVSFASGNTSVSSVVFDQIEKMFSSGLKQLEGMVRTGGQIQ